jgi:hypothetical protein
MRTKTKTKPATKPATKAEMVSAPKTKTAPKADAYSKLLADKKTSQQFSLTHERGANAGDAIGRTIGARHVVAAFLNTLGIGGTCKLADALAYALVRGTSHDATNYWLREQSTPRADGFGVKNVKYKIVNGTISVLRLHKSTASGRNTGSLPVIAKKKQ